MKGRYQNPPRIGTRVPSYRCRTRQRPRLRPARRLFSRLIYSVQTIPVSSIWPSPETEAEPPRHLVEKSKCKVQDAKCSNGNFSLCLDSDFVISPSPFASWRLVRLTAQSVILSARSYDGPAMSDESRNLSFRHGVPAVRSASLRAGSWRFSSPFRVFRVFVASMSVSGDGKWPVFPCCSFPYS
jgi:hypothetical protein